VVARGQLRRLLLVVCAIAIVGPASGACTSAATAGGKRTSSKKQLERGKATWYGGKFQGRKTASGERFDKRALTAAHRTLPFGSTVRVTNLANKRSVVVRVNDRGPYGKGRIIDVSEAAARKLKMIRAGVVPVTVEIIKRAPPKKRRQRKSRPRS
jgi:rare lipoprotein A